MFSLVSAIYPSPASWADEAISDGKTEDERMTAKDFLSQFSKRERREMELVDKVAEKEEKEARMETRVQARVNRRKTTKASHDTKREASTSKKKKAESTAKGRLAKKLKIK